MMLTINRVTGTIAHNELSEAMVRQMLEGIYSEKNVQETMSALRNLKEGEYCYVRNTVVAQVKKGVHLDDLQARNNNQYFVESHGETAIKGLYFGNATTKSGRFITSAIHLSMLLRSVPEGQTVYGVKAGVDTGLSGIENLGKGTGEDYVANMDLQTLKANGKKVGKLALSGDDLWESAANSTGGR
jgi:hypothetical protein